MKQIWIASFTALLLLGGCTGASDENPTITLKGDTDITLKVGEVIREPGYTATDPQDGDLTDKVQISSNLNFYKPGTYYVKYSVKDSDGNVAYATRTVTITQENSNYQGDVLYQNDNSTYDLASYYYLYQVLEEGKNMVESVDQFDAQGYLVTTHQFSLERNKSDNSIYVFKDNTITSHDFVGFDSISSYDANGYAIYQHRRFVKGNESYDEGRQVCSVVEHIPGAFNTQSVTHLNDKAFDYINVIHVQCNGAGKTEDRYYAQGWGEILELRDGYTFQLDKNSVQLR